MHGAESIGLCYAPYSMHYAPCAMLRAPYPMPIAMKNFFLSLKTTVWTLLGLVVVFFIGSYMMPVHRETFAPMNDGLLFDWVEKTAVQNLGQTWWFFAALAGLVLLTVNTLVCSYEAIRGRWSRADFLLRISPQVIHAGFLFILLAHLLGAGWGYKLSGMLPEGGVARLPENRALALQNVTVQSGPSGYMEGWSAEVALYENDAVVIRGTLGPNKPLFYNGVGVYLKSLDFERGPAAYLLVNKDPGAPWALVGSVLFMLGSIVLLALKWKKA
jgi:cytochrome c biogenesis protein ResB